MDLVEWKASRSKSENDNDEQSSPVNNGIVIVIELE